MTGSTSIPTVSLDPIRKKRFGFDQARHLLWRAGFGGTTRQILALQSAGPGGAVDRLLDTRTTDEYPSPAPDQFESSIVRPLSDIEIETYRRALREQDEKIVDQFRKRRQQIQRRDRTQVRQMRKWWLTRMIETPRPLEEKMTLFWHSHFATNYRTIENSYHMFLQNQLFRSHALGNFGELLFAIIRDPAMLRYLDNHQNVRGRPNENLARELMELFSLGVGHYSERDIKEGARALTGYTFRGNEFTFIPGLHDDGIKSILGKRANMDGDGFVRAILEQRACSEFIATKLYRFFVAEIPPPHTRQRQVVQRVVKALASTMRKARYDIRPVLRQLFLSEHFYDPNIVLARIKSPAELVVSTIRGLGTPARDLDVLLVAMDLMGQSLLLPPSVKGWDGERSWINTSTLYVRSNLANYLVTGQTPGGINSIADQEPYDPMPLLEGLRAGADRDPRAVAQRLLKLALGGRVSDERVWTVQDIFEQRGGINARSVTDALSVITAMPEYQLC